jgi:hypothetical protein
MIGFKEYLSEHIVVGDLKKSPTDLYYVAFPHDQSNRSKLYIIPKEKETEITFQFNSKALSIIEDIFEKFRDERPKYPYDEIKKELKSKITKLYSNLEQVSGFNYDKEIIEEAKKYIQDKALKSDGDWQHLPFIIGDPSYKERVFNAGGIKEFFKSESRTVKAFVVSYQKFVVNMKTKTIFVNNNPISHANRISRVSGDTTYIIPMADIDVDSPREIYKVLESLVKKYPYMKKFTYIDILTREQNRIYVEDVLNGAGEVGRTAKNYDNIFNKRGEITVYHGTSEKLYKDHIKTKGLRPGTGVDYVDKIAGHSENNVYFTNEIGDARKYAVRASGASSRSMVLSVKIRDFNKITFDEDNMYSAIKRMPTKILNVIKIKLFNMYVDNSSNSKYWAFQHTPEKVAEDGLESTTLEMWQLKRMADDSNIRLLIKPIMDFIGYYAIGGRSFTFAYKGVIMPKDIKVKETFKSKAYKDSGGEGGDWNRKNFKNKYSTIIKSMKAGK